MRDKTMIKEGSDEEMLLLRELDAMNRRLKDLAETMAKLTFTERCQKEALEATTAAKNRVNVHGREVAQRIETLEKQLKNI
jgi:hypothetical protein